MFVHFLLFFLFFFCLRHSGSCGLCASIAALIVSWSVSELRASYCRTTRSHCSKAWPLSPTNGDCSNCISIARYRPLCASSHSSRKRLQISNPFAGSLSFLECSIFRVHRQHERKLSCSSFLRLVHTGQGHFSQRIRFHIHEFQVEFFIHRRDVLTHLQWPTFPLVCFTCKRLRLVSNSGINQVYSGVLGRVNWSPCCSLRIDRRWLSHQLFLLMFDHCALLTHLRFQLLQPLRKFFHQIPSMYHNTHGDSLLP